MKLNDFKLFFIGHFAQLIILILTISFWQPTVEAIGGSSFGGSLFVVSESAKYDTGGVTSPSIPSIGYGIGLEFGSSKKIEMDVLQIPRCYGDSTYSTKINYLMVPILLRKTFWNSKISLGIGGYGAQISENVQGIQPSGSSSLTPEVAGFQTTDYGLTAALGFRFKIWKINTLLEGRYNKGLANVAKVEGISSSFDDVQILLGWTFGGANSGGGSGGSGGGSGGGGSGGGK